MRSIFITFLLLLNSCNLIAQTVENVDFEFWDYSIKVKYDLINCPENTVCNLNVFFTKSDGSIIYPKSITSLTKVYPGRSKTLIWDYKSDKIEYTGDLSVTIAIKNFEEIPPPPRIKKGPDNAIFSLLLPGWGDLYVNKSDKTSPIMISALYIGSGYLAYSSYNKANSYYDKYLKATTQSSMDDNYNLLVTNLSQSIIYGGIAAAVLVYDFIHVIVKGNRNVKIYKDGFTSLSIKPSFKYSKGISSCQFSLVKTF